MRILITGASSGIGAACARRAAEAGHEVVLAARTKSKLDALVSELGEKATAHECDVTDYTAQERLFETAGEVDVVFANAGVGASARGTEEGSPESFKAMILTNTLALTYTAKLAIPVLRRTKGHFVVTGSRAGTANLYGSVYGATKWFVQGYAQNLATELAGTRVRVTNIQPGMVDTPFFDTPKPDALTDDDLARAFMFAISQPESVSVQGMLIVPTPTAE